MQYDNSRPHSAPVAAPLVHLGMPDQGPVPDPRPKSTPSGMSIDSFSLSMTSSLEGAGGHNTSAVLLEGMSPSESLRQATPTPSVRSAMSTPPPHSPGAQDAL